MIIGLYCRDLSLPNGMTKATLAAAGALAALGHQIEILAETAARPARLVRLLGPTAEGAKIIRVGPPAGAAGRRLAARTARYGLFINSVPGAFFPSFAGKSWLWVRALPRARPRFLEYYRLLANSRFTKEAIRREWGLGAELLPPPVDRRGLDPLAKERLLLSVGTFGSKRAPKNELALIRLFSRLRRGGALAGWSYHLAGASEGGPGWLARLRREAAGAPVFLHPAPSFSELRKLYGKASLLWHACGALADPRKNSRAQEHFGAALVEAMAAGCLPLAFRAAGPSETIRHGRTGWLYGSIEELAGLTLRAADRPLGRLRSRARLRSREFSTAAFLKRASRLLES